MAENKTVEQLKVDRTKLRKISTYAKSMNLTPQRIYQLIESKDVKLIEIDGVKFIQVQ